MIYQNLDGEVRLDVRLEDETVWLTQAHMAQLFGKSKKTVSEHIQNIFKEGELGESALEYEKYQEQQRLLQHEESLTELEQDLKTLKPTSGE